MKTIVAGLFLLAAAFWESAGQTGPRPEIHVQLGHSNAVSSLCFSPDGRFVLSASFDASLRLWDAASGKEMRALKGHAKPVAAAAISPDGREVLSGGHDFTIRRWDLASGAQLSAWSEYDGLVGSISSVAYSPDGRLVLGGGADTKVRIWDVAAGRTVAVFRGHREWVNCAVFSADGRYAASGSNDASVRLWDVRSGKSVRVFEGSKAAVTALSFSSDNWYLLAGTADGALLLWAVETGKLVYELRGHADAVGALAFLPDNFHFLSAARDGTLSCWQTGGGKKIFSISGVDPAYTAVAVSPDGRSFVTGASNAAIRSWSLDSLAEERSFRGRIYPVVSAAFSPDGRQVLAASSDRRLRLWDLDSAKVKRRFEGQRSVLNSAVFSSDGKLVLAGGRDPEVRLWEVEGNQEARVFKGHSKAVAGVALSADGRLAASRSEDGSIRVWETESGKLISSIAAGSRSAAGLVFSPDGRSLISAVDDSCRIWSLPGGRLERVLRKDGLSPLTAVAVSPDGRRVLAGTLDETVLVWESASGKLIRSFKGHTGRITALACSPDGRTALSASVDATLRSWDIENWRPLRVYRGHHEALTAAGFSPDGKTLLSAGEDGTLRIWEADSGRWTALTAAADGNWLIFTDDGSWDGSRDCGELVAMVAGLEVWSIDQFAVRGNRPDLVLARLGSPDRSRMEWYRGLHRARAAKLGLAEERISSDYHVPQCRLLGTKRDGGFLELRLVMSDSREELARYNIWVNDVPLFGAYGKLLSGRTAEIIERIELGRGGNKIEAGCSNSRGAESFRAAAYATNEAAGLPDLYFLGFGVSDYRGEGINALKYAAKDALDLGRLFAASPPGSFGRITARVFTDAQVSRESIQAAKALLADAKPDDLLVLFVAGHGLYSSGAAPVYFFLPQAARLDDLAGTAAEFALLEDLLQGIRPRNKLFLLDTCASGERGELPSAPLEGAAGRTGARAITLPAATGKSARGLTVLEAQPRPFLFEQDRYINNDLLRRSGAVVFSSCTGSQYAWESDEFGNGLFTAYLLRGLAGVADLNRDGRVDVNELRKYVSEAVSTETKKPAYASRQTPTVDRDNLYQKFSLPVVP